MPRFDRGVVNTKLEKGDIVLMGNPTQYGEILAENILVEDILKADLETLISGSNLVRGKFYRITNAVSGTLSLLVQGLTANTICDYAYNTANGDLVTYNISTDLAGVPFSSVYVPYTGATADVDLGEYQIKVGQLELDQTPTGTFGVGKIRWNDTDGTPEVMLKGGNVTLQIGQEQLARVVNKTNTNLTEAGYQVVRISGAQGQRLKVGLAQANSTSTCKDTLGLVTENISNNAEGFITTSGLVRNINTTGSLQGETWADGDRLYLSPSVAGGITNVEPSAPNIVIVLGYVVYAHANQGSIFVSIEGAKALHELFDVSIPTPTNNNVLVYESSTGLWKDKSISTILGYTPANASSISGTTGKLAKFTSSGAVGDSIVSESGGVITITGTINSQPLLVTDGTQGLKIGAYAGGANYGAIYPQQVATPDGSNFSIIFKEDRTFINSPISGLVDLGIAGVVKMSLSATELITFGASDTGEAHIFGGSSRTNGTSYLMGNVGINTTSLFSEFTIAGANVRQESGQSTSTLFYSEFLNSARSLSVDYGHYAKNTTFNTRTGGSGSYFEVLKINDSGQISTLGASIASGESFIIGGSARVNGNTKIKGALSVEDVSSSDFVELSNDGTYSYLQSYNGALYLNSLGNNIILGGSGANVGIGTTSPSEKLTVNGNLKLTPSTSIIYGGDDVGLTAFSNSDLTTYISLYGSSGSHPTTPNVIRFHTSSTERMRIKSTGVINIASIPTSSAGLSAGDIWSDGGTLKIV